ncbi:hypothetical protein CAP35_08505 [Chitinophagaceae bacterium IBVUCB1]|nr:hypothetical protein CAP35_08505 [Chitinophagaceae bacterium IBVUCB1]
MTIIQANTANAEHKLWRQLFYAISIAILVLMPFISKDYGQSGDEWIQIDYGKHIWDYFTKGDEQALDYTNKQLQFSNQQYYGGFFDFMMEAMHQMMPSVPILVLRHFFNALLGALMMIFTGLLARRLTGKWQVGLVALLFILFSPRIFGESMNNPKDIPFATGFIIGIYYLVAILQDFPAKAWRHAIGLGLGFAIAFGVRAAGGILLLAYFGLFTILYYVLNKDRRTLITADSNKLAKKLVMVLAAGIAGGYVIGISTWPWGLQSPISNPLESLEGMTNREIQLRVLFEGVYRMSTAMPWYYEFKWIFITNPLIVLAGFLLFIALFTKLKERYGLFAFVLVVFGALFPILYMIYKHSTVYDTWRHVFFVYPFWAIAAAMGWDAVGTFIKNEKIKWVPTAVAIAGLLPAIVWTVRSHPNQYTYFNELAGGVKGAYGYYDLDYYQNSGKQAADWMLKNLKPIQGKKILVRSNMVGFDKYFAKDTNWIVYDYGRYTERHHIDWDYYVAYPRYISAKLMQDNNWKFQNTVHKVSIDGKPLCVIIKRNSTAGIAAYEAYEKKDYATAEQLYAAYIATDNTDEFAYFNYAISLASTGQMDAAITAMERATKLDPERVEFYDVLAQLYQAKGNMEGVQRAQSMKNEILMQQQETAGDE